MSLRELLAIPSLLQAKKVLFVQPHPDDAEWSAGGTVAALVEAGAEVVYVTVTDGSWGTMDPSLRPDELATLRREEQTRAAALLGVEEIAWLDFPDGHVPPGAAPELRGPLVNLIRAYRPDAVMGPDPWLPYEAHPDHYHTGLAVAAAVILAGLEPPHRVEGLRAHSPAMLAMYNTSRPNTFVAVDATWDRKIEAIAAHRSQFFGGLWEAGKEFLRLQAEELAERARRMGKAGPEVRLVEAFKVLSPLHLHCNQGAVDW
ncbi:MAG: PIG-L family deacetylase [Firmicutes bacterium]|nr:PIG-L family deacetylase [Bacillota bacterium]